MNEFKKNWLGHVITLIILLLVNFIMFSRTTNYQTSQKTQEDLLRLDREKASKVDLSKEEAARIEGDKLQNNELKESIKEIRQTLEDNNKTQTDRIIRLLEKYK